MSNTLIMAGFECGHPVSHNIDLLKSSRHTPRQLMTEHYNALKAHGISHIRDGLPWRHPAASRIHRAHNMNMNVVWDICHFDPAPGIVRHAVQCADIAMNLDDKKLFSCCAMNEPSMSSFHQMTVGDAARLGIEISLAIRDHISENAKFMTADPIYGEESDFYATDLMVAAGVVDVVGINFYPDAALNIPLSEVIMKTHERYHLPIVITETSWQSGDPGHHGRWPAIKSKEDWLSQVLNEVYLAKGDGADVQGVCWYPIVDGVDWSKPEGPTWPHGLIGKFRGVDLGLSEFIKAYLDEAQT